MSKDTELLYGLIGSDKIFLDTRFLGCIKPSGVVEELKVKEISPNKCCVKLYNERKREINWFNCKDVAVFDILY